MATLEREFRELPMNRATPRPPFWLHHESPKRLEEYVEKVAEAGNGSFTAESRPHSDWLGEGWFRDLAICLRSARRHDLKMWIFDEKWWPSQSVGGKVPVAMRRSVLCVGRRRPRPPPLRGPGTRQPKLHRHGGGTRAARRRNRSRDPCRPGPEMFATEGFPGKSLPATGKC